MISPDLTGRLRAFAADYPAVSDDLLETVDDYLISDLAMEFSLISDDEREQRIARLMNVRDVLREARDERKET